MKGCFTKTIYLFVLWEVIRQASGSPLSKQLHALWEEVPDQDIASSNPDPIK